jgi:transcriptional regulator with XRE-family HTH domain
MKSPMSKRESVLDPIPVGMRLKEARNRLGLSQQSMAEKIGSSKTGIQANEGGSNLPGAAVLASMYRLGVSVDWLLSGNGPMLLADMAEVRNPSPALDRELLFYVMDVVDQELKRRKLSLPNRKFAELVSVFYEVCLETGKRDPSIVERILNVA